MKNAGKTEDWLIERASGVWRKDPLRAILELFPFGTDPKYSLVRLQEPWRSRYPNCEYGLDAWACEVCDRIAYVLLNTTLIWSMLWIRFA